MEQNIITLGCGTIKASIISASLGTQIYDGISMIELEQEGGCRRLLEDFLPTMGTFSGTIYLLGDTDFVWIKETKGFYKFQEHQFTLVVTQE